MATTKLTDLPGFLKMHKRTIFKLFENPYEDPALIKSTKLKGAKEQLEDHRSEVFTCEFHPDGNLLLSGGIRNELLICPVYNANHKTMLMRGHHGAVMEAHFSTDGSQVFSCSADETLGIWDTFTGIRTSRLRGHFGCVNSMHRARRGIPMLCSAGDDSTLRVWDTRILVNAMKFGDNEGTTAICFNDASNQMFSGSLEPVIKVWDIRKCEVDQQLNGHTGAVTGIALSPCGSFLLSHSLDNTLRIWDVHPSFTGVDRCIRVFESNQMFINGNLLRCAWSPDGTMVTAGSAEEIFPVWNVQTGYQVAELIGHVANINDVDFHPNEPIVASASSDNSVFLHDMFYEVERFQQLTYF